MRAPGKVVLLTGVPAAGKTTLALRLSAHVEPLQVLSFGELLLETKLALGARTEHSDLRLYPTVEANADLISRATGLMLDRIGAVRDSSNVVVESHAVARDQYGFRATPDSAETLRAIRYDAIWVLHVSYTQFALRLRNKPGGRRTLSPTEFGHHESLQDAVAIAYGVTIGCPVYFLDATQRLPVLAQTCIELLDAIGASYNTKLRPDVNEDQE